MAGDIARPVDATRLLAEHGTSLRKALGLLERLACGEPAVVRLRSDDVVVVIQRFAALGIQAVALRLPEVDVQVIRSKFSLSQADFALRFGFELDTIQNWEQGRTRPDAAARSLLAVIERDPAIVEAVLTQSDARSES